MKKLAAMAFAALSVAAFAKTSTPEGWLDDYDAALKKAAAEQKHIVIDFSGSDWCGWCKRLDKEVFNTDAFRKGAKDKYVLLMVDSPNDSSLLTKKAAEQNPKLVEKFKVRGFPTVVVLDPKGKEVARLGYESGGPEKYLAKLDEEITFGPDIKKYIDPIEKVLDRNDSALQKEMEGCQRKATEMFFETVVPKYIPLYEKAFAEAKAMKVPEKLEARKKELIEEQEKRFSQLKAAAARYAEEKKADK